MFVCDLGHETGWTVVCEHGEWCAGCAIRHGRESPECRERFLAVAVATVDAVMAGHNPEEAQLVGGFDLPAAGGELPEGGGSRADKPLYQDVESGVEG